MLTPFKKKSPVRDSFRYTKKPMVGFEPTTGRLRSDYSTPELHRLVIVSHRCCMSAFDTSYYSVMCPWCQAIFVKIEMASKMSCV